MKPIYEPKGKAKEYGEYAAELTDVYTERDCEVIGNIHDNPELLRSDTE